MSNQCQKLNQFQPYFLAFLRIVAGYTFLLHGTSKFFFFPKAMGDTAPALFSLFGIGGILEIVLGAFIVLGLFTRISAFILSGQSAVIYFMFHAEAANVLYPLMNGGESAVLFCFIFLYLVFAGAGAFALDNKLCRK